MSEDQHQVALRIDGTRKKDDSALTGWEVEAYELDGLSRGEKQQVAPDALALDAVIELELANGTRILVAAEDAGRYLGEAAERGAGEAGRFEVGQALRLSGLRLPGGATRDGLGSWILKGLRIYRQGPAGMTALIAAGTFQDAQLDDHDGLYRCATMPSG